MVSVGHHLGRYSGCLGVQSPLSTISSVSWVCSSDLIDGCHVIKNVYRTWIGTQLVCLCVAVCVSVWWWVWLCNCVCLCVTVCCWGCLEKMTSRMTCMNHLWENHAVTRPIAVWTVYLMKSQISKHQHHWVQWAELPIRDISWRDHIFSLRQTTAILGG